MAWVQYSLGVRVCYWNFFLFSLSKISDANVGIIANVAHATLFAFHLVVLL